MKRSEAAEIVLTLIKAYPHVRCDGQTADIYERRIADLEAAQCRAAVTRLIDTSKFFPAIAEIREACSAQSHGAARTGEEAYAELTAAVRVHGRDYGQGVPTFRDPIVARCIGVWGSWNDLCGSPVDDAGGRARFVELYDELATRARQDLAAGRALPSPQNGTPAFWLGNRVPALSAGAPATAPGATRNAFRAPVAPSPGLTDTDASTRHVGALVNIVVHRPQSVPADPSRLRKWTAEELDAELSGKAGGGMK